GPIMEIPIRCGRLTSGSLPAAADSTMSDSGIRCPTTLGPGKEVTRVLCKAPGYEVGFTGQGALQANKNWVKEFYATLLTVNWILPDTVAYVQGMQTSLCATSINEALGLPNPPEAELKTRDTIGNGWWLVDTLLLEEHRASSY
ncbi:hypothetical protein HAX54_040518, partial [Datura stramonium]|nr:hypothetical protein [Datura stramonium]